MASHYLNEIRRVQSDASYHFLGFSFGGLVAFEMARQLHARGHAFGLVGMLDTRSMVIRTATIETKADHERKLLTSHLTQLMSSKGGVYAVRKLRARLLRITYTLLDRVRQPIPRFLQSPEDINWFAGVNYTPRPFPGKLTLFETVETAFDIRSSRDVWRQLAGGVEVREVPGGHEEILKEPHVRLLAREVTDWLAKGDSSRA